MPAKKCFICGMVPAERKVFWFPKPTHKCQAWINALDINASAKDLQGKKRLCENHFSAASFRTPLKVSLNYNAVPKPVCIRNVFQQAKPSGHLQRAMSPMNVTDPTHSDLSMTSVDMYSPLPSTSSEHPPSGSTFVSSSLRLLSEEQRKILNSEVCLTPRKKVLYDALKRKHRYLKRLKSMCKARRHKITELCRQDTEQLVTKVFKGCNKRSTAVFLLSQIRGNNCKPKGRKWSLEEKIIALSLYKRSPKAYFLLRSFTALPARSTLLSLLAQVPFSAGINGNVLQHLTECVQQMSEDDRVCTLMFDEMSIRQHIQYDPASDVISGYEDYGTHRCNSYANTALVFMLQGLKRNWKQPVAFYFVNSKTSSQKLADCIREVLDVAFSSGLEVLATVCDMGTNNVKALQLLGGTFEHPYFSFKDHTVFIIYDPPHLLKCTRNLFLKYPIRVPMQVGSDMTFGNANIGIVKEAFEVDRREMIFRTVPKLTLQHISPDSFSKMKVSLAAQLLSHSVASLILHNMMHGVLSSSALATATFVRDMDLLFDSWNGTHLYPVTGKELRIALSTHSGHLQFWAEMTTKISQWRFEGLKAVMPPSQKGWLLNIRAVNEMWKTNLSRRMDHLRTRSLNQDALENLFGGIRSYCGDNNNPTSTQFVSCLKTHVINGLSNIGLRGANCESDCNELLSNFQTFLQRRSHSDARNPPEDNENSNTHRLDQILEFVTSSFDNTAFNRGSANVYVSGFIAKRILKDIACELCTATLTSHPEKWINDFITFKEYSDNVTRLTYPSERLVNAVTSSANIIENTLPNICHTSQIGKQLTEAIYLNVDFSWISCSEHLYFLREGIVRSVCCICIPWYCTRINRNFKTKSITKKASCKVAILQHT